jgi:oxygen-independent coproporphyrinogen-3 oxidase
VKKCVKKNEARAFSEISKGASTPFETLNPSGFAPPVYIQVPFCPERCDYCSIPVSVNPSMVSDYLTALEKEVARVLPGQGGRPPLAVYVGGGSPTSLPDDSFKRLLSILEPLFRSTRELTFESRPEALTPEKIALLGGLPSLRLSLGMEAPDAGGLLSLGRSAPFFDPVPFLRAMKDPLRSPISMDFICTGGEFSVPGFLDLSRRLLEEGLDHLSVYPLVIEAHTVSALRKAQKRTEEDLEERAAENWREVCEGLSASGWIRYEVSNFSRKEGGGCLYNLHVWKGGDYRGLGSGSHQKMNSVRYENVRSIQDYVRIMTKENRHPYDQKEVLSDRESDLEFLYTNLRLRDGLPVEWLLSRTTPSSSVRLIEEFVRYGAIEKKRTDEGVLVLTGNGLYRLDEIAQALFGCFRETQARVPPFTEPSFPDSRFSPASEIPTLS